jgi:hypothetical protein
MTIFTSTGMICTGAGINAQGKSPENRHKKQMLV